MIKENIYRLIVIILIVIFAAGLFFTINFLRKKVQMVTNPSADTLKVGAQEFNMKAYEEVSKRLGIE